MIQIDKDRIREEISNRTINLKVHENWLTPAGRERSAPMYEVTIENPYLGKSRFLKKQSISELESVARDQLEKWAELEFKAKCKEAETDIKEKAELEWIEKRESLSTLIGDLRGILHATVDVDDRLDWKALEDHTKFPPFNYSKTKPVEADMPSEPEEPRKGVIEIILPFLWRRKWSAYENALEEWKMVREARDAEHKKALQEWNRQKLKAMESWQKKKEEFEKSQEEGNESVSQLRARYENKDPAAFIEYLSAVFEESSYPEGFTPEYEVSYDPDAETTVVTLGLPDLTVMPEDSDYKLKKTTAEVNPVPMKDKDRSALYDSAIQQTVIRTIHEVFESDYAKCAMQVVVNGWVTYIDSSSGIEKTSCIISVSADREQFEQFNLKLLDPGECIKALKGVTAGPLSNIAPVRPILQLDREDKRFVESEAILADLNSTTNLAEIKWEDFEHLVRELFSKLFSGESSEVRVTQASADGGIDAIAFDDDPIRGGKFVIQAKRYTKVVPVSAARDLYGTMISEGATKGILVTTAHFGRDTRSFVKDKPITLIDGSNLVYLLEEHGHKVRIDIEAARAKLGAQYRDEA